MNCPNCGTAATEGAAFCINCGGALKSAPALVEGESGAGRYCARCGTGLRAADVYCSSCGAPVVMPAPPLTARQRRVRYVLLAGAAVVLVLLTVGGVLGYQAWRQARALEAHYGWGLSALEAGDYQTALQELGWVAAQSPDYEDTRARLAEARAQGDRAGLFAQAQGLCNGGQWAAALDALEALRAQAPDYQTGEVTTLLVTAHHQMGLALAGEGQFEPAVAHFDAALALQARDETERQKQLATGYPQGLAALQGGDYARAAEILAEVYNLDPAYHTVADRLYEAHAGCCAELADQGQLDQAEAACQAALAIKTAGPEAQEGLARIAFLRIPTATPTFTPTPTPSPTPTPEVTPTFTPTPTRTPTPRPRTPSCLPAKKGWIGFKRQNRCNTRTGAGCGTTTIWVMKADGTQQAPMCDASDYRWGLEMDRTHPDGTWYVDVARNRGNDIRRVYRDGRKEWIIVNNRSDWDPVLSADGWWLAWVTNRNGNDEIYIKTMDPGDQNQRRLTVNAWEWDKHPSWSPDGHKIAFYSNRADSLDEATRQIWVMEIVNDQGVQLRNLSNRPNKVDTDPVWFKWDNVP